MILRKKTIIRDRFARIIPCEREATLPTTSRRQLVVNQGMLVACLVVWAAVLAPESPAVEPAPGAPRKANECAESTLQALREAEALVEAARARDALWTTAAEALDAARVAQAQGECEQAAGAARLAQEQARLGIEQLRYPDFQWLIED
jgi:murein lipoprotein